MSFFHVITKPTEHFIRGRKLLVANGVGAPLASRLNAKTACASPVNHGAKLCRLISICIGNDNASFFSHTREWAVQHGIDQNYFEGVGPCHQILAENGFSLPGTLQVGTDSHTCTAGAFGCLGTGIGSTEMAGVLITGEIWLRVPETILFRWNGKMPDGVMAKDLILKSIGTIGHAGATYMSMEFQGDTIRNLPMDERMCISNMCVEAGAKCGLIPADEKTDAYLKEHGCNRPYTALSSDAGAHYAQVLEFNTAELEPQVACPHNVDNVHPITEVKGTRMHRAYLGSCTGGRLNDLRTAAQGARHHPETGGRGSGICGQRLGSSRARRSIRARSCWYPPLPSGSGWKRMSWES